MATVCCFLILAGCGSDKPTTFSRGEAIPMGEATLKIGQAEVSSQFLSTYTGSKTGLVNAVVHLTLQMPLKSGQKPLPEKLKLLNRLSLTIITDDGKKIGSPLILPASHYRLMLAGQAQDHQAAMAYLESMGSGTETDDFVAVFIVPEKTRGLTVHAYNPSWAKAQPRLAAVQVW
jgi:hypothetical protein